MLNVQQLDSEEEDIFSEYQQTIPQQRSEQRARYHEDDDQQAEEEREQHHDIMQRQRDVASIVDQIEECRQKQDTLGRVKTQLGYNINKRAFLETRDWFEDLAGDICVLCLVVSGNDEPHLSPESCPQLKDGKCSLCYSVNCIAEQQQFKYCKGSLIKCKWIILIFDLLSGDYPIRYQAIAACNVIWEQAKDDALLSEWLRLYCGTDFFVSSKERFDIWLLVYSSVSMMRNYEHLLIAYLHRTHIESYDEDRWHALSEEED